MDEKKIDEKSEEEAKNSSNFIIDIIDGDLESGKRESIVTRFPPEPNGYLHIGHAKSICLNFGVAKQYGGRCHLRFDDTNPEKEDTEYTNSIQEDVKWLGFDWGDNLYYASDYFEKLYQFAVQMIKEGTAFVCSLSGDEVKKNRGTATGAGVESPYRNRSVEENLELFSKMRNGEFKDGEQMLRAKIDMAHPSVLLRDPVLYRIKHMDHHRKGSEWCIYPMYDFAHGFSDAIEGITHSLCTLEFEAHRPLYNWLLDAIHIEKGPQQIEFARLNLSYTVMSKRKLMQLVDENLVNGWDDPRLPTISGLRRRGYTPESIRDFADRIGVAKRDSMVDIALLEHCIREDLNRWVPRRMGVLNPLKMVVTNYNDSEVEYFDAMNNPEKESDGTRKVPFSKELWIERDDFREVAPRKWRRLAPGKEVRLRSAYYVTLTDIIKDETGEVVEIHCTYDPESKGGWTEDERKVRGTIHWVSVAHAAEVEVRLYEPLFTVENPLNTEEDKDFKEYINPESLSVVQGFVEPLIAEFKPEQRFQFERLGYFVVDKESTPEKIVINRVVSLKERFKPKN
ncbi:glutamine--tRNA ligase/YqeY domain fusion protein [bacterium]|nr:glutamine--tRNA ligase/YqeY domain fusion protein [bacterium]